jgi:hypothetical protein
MFIIQDFLGCDSLLGQLDPDDRGTLLLRNANTNLTVENTLIFIDTVLATSILAFPQCLFMSVNVTFFPELYFLEFS